MKYAEKYGVSRASRKYNKSQSYTYFWRDRWDGSVASLACQSWRAHSHPNQHTESDLKLIYDMRRRPPSLDIIELWHRLWQRGYTPPPGESVLGGVHAGESVWNVSRPIMALSSPTVFPTAGRDLPTLFEATASRLGIRHKIIRSYTPSHNGKVECSHRGGQNTFTPATAFILWTTSQNSSLSTTAAPTTSP